MKQLLQRYPWFLLLLPSFVVLHIESEYHHFINYHLVYPQILVLFAAAVIVYCICALLIRPAASAALLSFLILLVFYFFGELKDWLHRVRPNSFWQSYTFLLPSVLLLMILSYLTLRKRARSAILFVNVAFLLFILADIAALLFGGASSRKRNSSPLDAWVPCTSCARPDIYYIIFDSYTSVDLLKDEFHLDNTRIVSYLESKGFKVVRHSTANYNRTPLSMESTFNLDYLPSSYTTKEYFLKNYLAGINTLYNTPLIPLMRAQGYNVYNHSIFDFREVRSTIPPFDIWSINALYERHNLVKKIVTDVGWRMPWMHKSRDADLSEYTRLRDAHDSATMVALKHTAALSSTPPKFVYGHLFQPHNPYSFDSSGRRYEPLPDLDDTAARQGYLQQIIYSNSLIKQLVDTLLAFKTRPTIIIIQGDHGYRHFASEKIELEFPNFNAIYFSGGNYSLINDSMSNVNTFRAVFNTFFGQHFPMLPKRINFVRDNGKHGQRMQ